MARRISPAQLQSKLRQDESRRRQAIDKHNRDVRQHNQRARSAVNKFNRDMQSAVNKQNSAIRAHNARVRADRQRVRQGLARLRARSATGRYPTFRVSVEALHDAYVRYESQVGSEPADRRHAELLDLAEREDANSLGVINALLGDAPDSGTLDAEGLRSTRITDELQAISKDLDDRWRGALYALSPQNPDAARHFCTSAREILVKILDYGAPDGVVLEADAHVETNESGLPTRQAKVRHVLNKSGVAVETLGEFMSIDIDNVLQLFRIFNSGTHGTAGKYDLPKLVAIKDRVEGTIVLLARIVRSR